LEAHEVQYPFEVVGQGRQTPFTLNFGESLQQEMGVTKPALDGPEGMLGQRLPQLELFRVSFHPLGHRFHQVFVGLPRDRAVGLVPRAAILQRTRLAAAGPIVLQFPPQLVRAEGQGTAIGALDATRLVKWFRAFGLKANGHKQDAKRLAAKTTEVLVQRFL
jgi:hypothetical protein